MSFLILLIVGLIGQNAIGIKTKKQFAPLSMFVLSSLPVLAALQIRESTRHSYWSHIQAKAGSTQPLNKGNYYENNENQSRNVMRSKYPSNGKKEPANF